MLIHQEIEYSKEVVTEYTLWNEENTDSRLACFKYAFWHAQHYDHSLSI